MERAAQFTGPRQVELAPHDPSPLPTTTRLAQLNGADVTAVDALDGRPATAGSYGAVRTLRPRCPAGGPSSSSSRPSAGSSPTAGYEGFLTAECRLTGDPVEAVRSVPGFLRRAAA
ncbi:hypothetical protein ACH429_03720 [Streptomyces pathocidini]|uniref:Uncharacterized protein n=1 Tax=Streptomyces pathocidini TaxID=1650571 RepID=A0ABW7UR24_9ACTN